MQLYGIFFMYEMNGCLMVTCIKVTHFHMHINCLTLQHKIIKLNCACSWVNTYRGVKQKNHWLSGVGVDGFESFFHRIFLFEVNFNDASVGFSTITTAEVGLKSKPSQPANCFPKVSVRGGRVHFCGWEMCKWKPKSVVPQENEL